MSTLHDISTVVYPDDKRMRISYCFKENTFPVHTSISVQTGTPASGRNFLSLCHKEQVTKLDCFCMSLPTMKTISIQICNSDGIFEVFNQYRGDQ